MINAQVAFRYGSYFIEVLWSYFWVDRELKSLQYPLIALSRPLPASVLILVSELLMVVPLL